MSKVFLLIAFLINFNLYAKKSVYSGQTLFKGEKENCLLRVDTNDLRTTAYINDFRQTEPRKRSMIGRFTLEPKTNSPNVFLSKLRRRQFNHFLKIKTDKDSIPLYYTYFDNPFDPSVQSIEFVCTDLVLIRELED